MSEAGIEASTESNAAEPPPILRRHVLAATMGNVLEFYDFTTFAFFATQIGATFFPSKTPYVSLMASLATFGAGFIFRPVGGIVLGRYADRVGRRPSMMLSFMMMGGALLALALIPSYAAIGVAAPILVIAARMLQGFALGGEVGSTTTFLFEASPVKHRGLYTSLQGVSQSIASLVGGGVGVLLSSVMSEAGLQSYGWRIAFLIGGITLPVGLYLRNRLPETLHLPDHAAAYKPLHPERSVFHTHGRVIVLGLLLFMSGTVATYVFNYMTTFAHAILHMNTTVSFAVTAVISACAIVSGTVAAVLSDRIGRRIVMIVPRVLFLLAIYPIFFLVVRDRSPEALLVGLGFLSVLSAASQAAFYAAVSEALPKAIRGTGFAVIYATSISVFGGTTQLVVTWLIHVTGDPMAAAWYLLTATGIGLVAMILLAETAPARLEAAARAA